MSNLKVEIEELCKHPANTRRVILRNTIEYNENVSFPFESIIKSMRIIFPNKQLIFNFTIL